MQAIRTITTAIGLALIASSVMAEAAKPSTYVCVEERSVGWEPREGKSDYVGQFQPKPAPKIVKYYSATGKADARVPGYIEVIANGETSKFESDECRYVADAMQQDRRFGINRPVDEYAKMCVTGAKSEFGGANNGFYFSGNLDAGKKTIRYREHLLVGIVWAYVEMGTCTLFEG